MATIRGARRYGGVSLEADGDFIIDASATEALREKMLLDRGDDIPLFNNGGALSELIARCEEDTGLAPPSPPVFPSRVQRELSAE